MTHEPHGDDDALQPPADDSNETVNELTAAATITGPSYAEIRDSLDDESQEEADDALSRLRRHGDEELFNKLLAGGFSGPLWTSTSHELARYGIAVIKAWLRTGHIGRMLDQRGIVLELSEYELRTFASDRDERADQANSTVAHALADFKKRSLQGRGWNPAGGAQITTYFTGGCILAFPNQLRARRSSSNGRPVPIDIDDANKLAERLGQTAGIGVGPPRQVVSADELERVRLLRRRPCGTSLTPRRG